MIKNVKGTKDIYYPDIIKWNYITEKIKSIFNKYGYYEIIVPVFEYTELFMRGIGEGTDIVNKEMYTFQDKKGRWLTLRPEGTASVIRSINSNNLSNTSLPIKYYYIGSMYRYERPQKGRYREFYQAGIEYLNNSDSISDVETVLIGNKILKTLSIKSRLEINSVGCKECRPGYEKKLREYFSTKKDELCNDCRDRLEKNVLRILDCKNKRCRNIIKSGPTITDSICGNCNAKINKVKCFLDELEIEYKQNPFLVRGLDYYTGFVYEFISNDDGLTVLAGGRYDNLSNELFNKDIPAVGFALGIDRIFNLFADDMVPETRKKIYILPFSEDDKQYSFILMYKLRDKVADNYIIEIDSSDRSFKGKMKNANKFEADYVIIIGEAEQKNDILSIKDMKTGEQNNYTFEECLKYLRN